MAGSFQIPIYGIQIYEKLDSMANASRLYIGKTDKTNRKIGCARSVGNSYLCIVKHYLSIMLIMLSTLVAAA